MAVALVVERPTVQMLQPTLAAAAVQADIIIPETLPVVMAVQVSLSCAT